MLCLTLLFIYSCVHISWNEVFFLDSEQIIQGAKINDNSYESQADFHWEKRKKIEKKSKWPTQKNRVSFLF